MRDAVASDVAVHGFMYIGVLVTVVAIVGFLVFAFTSVPDAQQPYFELAIATVFFGWSWVLRRSGVDLAATAMEFIGGFVLPLVVFAGLVDDVPFPPDAEGGALVVALTATAVVLAGVYALITARRPDSALRFLVAPLLWLAAMALGFVFKTDEPLVSDAITRLVSPQPALGAVAIALTLLAVRRWPEHRLATPTTVAAIVGLPVAYLLTLSLAASEGWTRPTAIAVLGAAGLVSAELLARRFDRTAWLPSLRPVLAAGIVAPLAPTLEAGWTAVTLVAVYGGLLERELRTPQPRQQLPAALAGAGLLAGSALAATVPWATLVVATALTLWAHQRRIASRDRDRDTTVPTLLAALLPVGIGNGLVGLLALDVAWLVMAGLVAGIAVAVRVRPTEDTFWPAWLTAAGAAVALGAVDVWVVGVPESPTAVVAVAVTTVTLALAPRLRPARLWLGAATATTAALMATVTAQVPGDVAAVLWAATGLALVVDATVRRGDLVGHRTLLGHAIGVGTLVALPGGIAGATVLWAWTLGWAASSTTIGAPDSMTALLGRIGSALRDPARVTRASDADEVAAVTPPSDAAAGTRPAAWMSVLVTAISIPVTVVTTANLWPTYAANRPWTGMTLAVLAVLDAVVARRSSSPVLVRSAAASGIALSLLGVAVAVPASWPVVAGAASLIACAALLRGTARPAWFVWVAWAMSVVVVVVLAERAGLATSALHQVAAVWGGTLLLGGLLLDDVLAGRRELGDGLRRAWLRYPVLLGALLFPVAVGPVFGRTATVYGWWSVGAAVVYLVVARLLRLGAVAAPAYVLATVALDALLPWSLVDDPWLLAPVAGVLLVGAWILERRRSPTADPVTRWDLAPFVVAHVLAVFALAAAIADGDIVATALGLALLALGVAVWRRHLAWLLAANALLLTAAADAGPGWLSLTMLGTTAHAVVGVWRTRGLVRGAYQVTAVTTAALAWLSLLAWQGPGARAAVDWSALLFGGLALAVVVAGRLRRIALDTLLAWSSLALLGVGAALGVALAPLGPGVDGPWLALSVVMLAGGLQLAAAIVHRGLALVAVAAVGIAWALLVAGLGWSSASTVTATALVFGTVALLSTALAHVLTARPGHGWGTTARAVTWAWLVLGTTGVLAVTVIHLAGGDGAAAAVVTGLGLLALATARGARPLATPALLDLSPLLALAAVDVALLGAAWSRLAFATTTVLLATAATGVAVALWRRGVDVGVRPALVLATAANVQAVGIAADAWPTRSLLVAALASLGVQAVAVGLTRRRTWVLASGPPLLGLAFVLAVGEGLSGSAQWITVPVGLVLLSEVEVLRLARWGEEEADGSPGPILPLEWAGLGFLVGPALVELFTRGLVHALVAAVVAVSVLVWGIVTRLRRRVVAAGSVAVVTAVLTLFAAAAASAARSARVWIVAAGIGFSVMLVSAWMEAWRSRRGRVLTRLDHLMEDWG